MRPFLERGHLAVPHLVQDASGVFVAEVVEAAALAGAELVQRGRREFGCEGQRLETREDAVAAEHRHEPRQTRGRQAPSARGDRREPERREVDEALAVRRLQRFPVAFEARRVVEPLLEVSFHVRARLALAAPVLGLAAPIAPADDRGHDHSSIDHEPCGSIRQVNVRPSSSMVAGTDAEIIVSRRNVSRS